MKKELQRFFFMALILLASAGLAFGGARTQSGGTGSTAGGKPTLTIGLESNSFITDYKANYQTQYLERLHNINIDLYLLPTDGAEIRTKVSLMVASSDLPDLYLTQSLTPESIFDYGTKGAFIPMNKYIENPSLSPSLNAMPAADKKGLLEGIVSADGNYYTLGQYFPTIWNSAAHRIYINRQWLEKLGLRVPATTDELRNVLLAFRDRDPNGNGRKDEIGVYGRFDGGYGENIITALLNSFVFYRQGNLALDESGNRVIAPFTQAGFRKGLQYINGLYREGVLAASLFTDDTNQFRATLASDPDIVGLVSAGSAGNWPNAEENPHFLALAMIAPFKGPDGIQYTPYTAYAPNLIGNITSAAKDPDLAFKFLDKFYDHEVSMLTYFGEKEVDWTEDPAKMEGWTNAYLETGIFSKPSMRHDMVIDLWVNPNNKTWHGFTPLYWSEEFGLGRVNIKKESYDGSNPVNALSATHYQLYVNKWPAHVIPQIKFSVDEAARTSGPITNINEYVKQSIAEFVTGIRDINSDTAWNAYLRELDNMGLQQWLTAAQTAYTRQRR
jgi:putative aldouronate transport system substrate-binding protein